MRHGIHNEHHHRIGLAISPFGHTDFNVHASLRIPRNEMVSVMRHSRPVSQGLNPAVHLDCRIRFSYDRCRQE
jgi:hypothetical protein